MNAVKVKVEMLVGEGWDVEDAIDFASDEFNMGWSDVVKIVEG